MTAVLKGSQHADDVLLIIGIGCSELLKNLCLFFTSDVPVD